MAVEIDATVGGSSANSFVLLADADTYLDGRLNATAWTGASDDTKGMALVEATRELSSLCWLSTRVSDTQALSWPRQMVPNPDSSSWFSYFATTVVPDRVKQATYELALEFLRSGTTDVASLPSTDSVIEKTVDVLTTRYAAPSQRRRGIARYPRVQRLISPLLDGSAGQMRVVRG